MIDPRGNILNSYQTTIEESLRENRSQIKLINYGTGSGKTHMLFQAMYEAIKTHSIIQIIGIYVAPLREHLRIPQSLKEQYHDIPVYTINSLEMKTTNEFMNLYKEWFPNIINNKKFWHISPKEYSAELIQENQQSVKRVRTIINQIEFLKRMDWDEEEFQQSQIKKMTRELEKLIEKFLQFFINCKRDETTWPDECVKLMEIFYPLYLLREKSGIVMLTCKKFETAIPYFKFNGKTWIEKKLHLDRFVSEQTNDFRKFILAFDEQEDGYNIMLEEMIDIISPKTLAINNVLSSINREFSVLFSVNGDENRKFLKFIEKNPGAFYEFNEHIEKNKPIESRLIEFARIYRRLTIEEGNSSNFLKNIARIYAGLEKSLEKIANIFDDFREEKPVSFNFSVLHNVLSKFENNRSLLIPYEIYQKIGQDLMNIFSFNNLYIYNIDPLKQIFLSRCSSGHVNITEDNTSTNASVAELIYIILAVRLQLKAIKDFLANVLDAEDSQSRSLEIWSKQVAKIQKASEDDASQKSNYLNRAYVYEGYKSIINIMEISRYQNPTNNLINHELREVSIGSTAILTSPEKTIKSLSEKCGNTIFFISATGGIRGDLSTSFDMSYLEDGLRDETGQSTFKSMEEQEILLCEEIRNYRHLHRQITVNFFNAEIASCPNNKTQNIIDHFEKIILKNFITSITGDGGWFGAYKIQELKNFIRFLFYLFEDDAIQEIFAFTQTLQWIRKLIYYCEKAHDFNYTIEESTAHPDMFYVRLNHPKKYQSPLKKVKLILFSAAFNSRYKDKTIEKTYLDELHEELGQKIFFISAYRSASKGLNPTIKTQNGIEKDFDALVLLMDTYYSIMKPAVKNSKKEKTQESGKATTLYHFALMKSIVASGESIEIKSFNDYLNKPEAAEFREKQHQILLGKGILQSIGRIERRDFPGQIIKIFINEETRKNLADFYKYLVEKEPYEIQKLSVNNYEVYLRVMEEEQKHTIADYDEHVYREIEASLAIYRFRQKMLDEIENFHHHQNTFEITKAWEALRSPSVFKDPKVYLAQLKKTKLFPDDFVEALFYYNAEQVFTPYIALAEEEGQKFQIISDSVNGEKVYAYQRRLYPDYLKFHAGKFDSEEIEVLNPSAKLIYRLYRKLIPQPEIFHSYIPRPHFFYDVLYPSFAENFVEQWIKDVIFGGNPEKYGFEQLKDFTAYNILYEKFDLYYVKENELFCIDVKAWSNISGNRLSMETLEKAKKKLIAIASEYSKFSKVNGLLLNLHSSAEKSHQYSPNLFSGNLIFFDEQHLPIESKVLRKFLFSKEK